LRPLEIKSDDDASKFLRLACITYFGADHPSRSDRARQIFAEKPHLAKANLYSAAAVGDVAAVADFLTRGADVHAKGGPFNWEPLLYAAYSRLDSQTEGHSTLEVARLLLAAGADPNAGFLWDGGYVLTALTGVLGLGEDDCGRGDGPLWQPPHEHWREFARLLLDAGEDPNGNQGIYNRMQQSGNEHLKLLVEYGLGTDRGGPWFKRFRGVLRVPRPQARARRARERSGRCLIEKGENTPDSRRSAAGGGPDRTGNLLLRDSHVQSCAF
jgi:hypothetical protein